VKTIRSQSESLEYRVLYPADNSQCFIQAATMGYRSVQYYSPSSSDIVIDKDVLQKGDTLYIIQVTLYFLCSLHQP
jgi:hypothetical protein